MASRLDIIAERDHIDNCFAHGKSAGTNAGWQGGLPMGDGKSGLQLRSLVKKSGELELSLVNVPTPEPGEDEVVVRVEATPINPSDLGLLMGPADMSSAQVSGTKDAPVITARMPEAAMR